MPRNRPDYRVLWRPAVGDTPRYRLVCFHHAGGGTGTFASWLYRLPGDVELIVPRLPGRESRLGEQPHTDFSTAIAEIVEILRPLVCEGVPFAYFGHSMGGIVAHEANRVLASEGAPTPLFLAVSAAPAPHRQLARAPRLPAGYDRGTVTRILRDFAGTDPAALADEELLDLVLPAFEADLLLLDSYRPVLSLATVACPLLTFVGEYDSLVPTEDVEAWRECAGSTYERYVLRAGHFFLESNVDEILERLDSW